MLISVLTKQCCFLPSLNSAVLCAETISKQCCTLPSLNSVVLCPALNSCTLSSLNPVVFCPHSTRFFSVFTELDSFSVHVFSVCPHRTVFLSMPSQNYVVSALVELCWMVSCLTFLTLLCVSLQCFDLESYLKLNCERGTWRCPVCK